MATTVLGLVQQTVYMKLLGSSL